MSGINFDGQVAVVTGSSRSLGRAFAIDLGRRGARVVVNGRPQSDGSSPAVDEVVNAIRSSGGHAVPSYSTVATQAGGAEIIDTALSAFGRVDILVNNAGFLRPGMFDALSALDIDSVIEVHLRSIFNVTQPALAAMRRNKYGRIINVSSTTAMIGLPGCASYSAAKGGVMAVTRALSSEVKEHGILVNCLVPSAIGKMQAERPIPGFNRSLSSLRDRLVSRMDPSTVAPMTTFLASSACKLSGEVFAACAGRFSRIAIVAAQGWLAEEAEKVTAEDVALHIEKIRDVSDFIEPSSLAEIYQNIVDRLKKA